MDKAYWGTMRWGHFRWGVYDPQFDRVLEAKKKLAPKFMGGVTPSVVGTARVGMTRVGVFRAEFDAALERMKKE